jgi:hypothetical protein
MSKQEALNAAIKECEITFEDYYVFEKSLNVFKFASRQHIPVNSWVFYEVSMHPIDVEVVWEELDCPCIK